MQVSKWIDADQEIVMSTKTETKKSTQKSSSGFTADEKAAMKARAQELKAEAKASKNREEGEKALLAAIAQMKDANDRSMGKRIHELVTAAAPELMPKPGMECLPMRTKMARSFVSFRRRASLGCGTQLLAFSLMRGLTMAICGLPALPSSN